jgi:hypothetical protein
MAGDSKTIHDAHGIALSVSGWRDLLGYKNSNSVYEAIAAGYVPKASVRNATTGAPLWGFPEFLVAVYRSKHLEKRFRGPGKEKCERARNEHIRETWETAELVLDAFDTNPRFFAEYVEGAQAVMAHTRDVGEIRRQALEAMRAKRGEPS